MLNIKIVLDKTKQLLGLLLTLTEICRVEKAHRGLGASASPSLGSPPDIFLCKVSNKPNN